MGMWSILGFYLAAGVIIAQTVRVVALTHDRNFGLSPWLMLLIWWGVIIPFGLYCFIKERLK